VQVMAIEDKTVVSEGETTKATGGGNNTQHRLVTLQVAPKEAELLQLVRATKGEVSLTMRNPLERGARNESSSSTSLSQVLELLSRRSVNSQVTVETPAEPTPDRPQWSVVVMHGSNMEKQT
jgi:Flp pilus assembly protein CpaB